VALAEFDWSPAPGKLRTFGAALAVLAAALGILLHLWGRIGPVPAALSAALGISAGAAALFRPSLLRPLYILLQIPAWPVGLLVGHLVLAFMFYLVLTPLGLLRRAMGKDPLGLARKESPRSYWIPRRAHHERDRYFRQF